MAKQSDECLICGAPLEYLDQPVEMECAICHKKYVNNVHCKNGHYVCDECHTSGVDAIVGLCLEEKSTDPVEILEKMMSFPTCHMHGPEHHVMVGASLLTAYHNAGGEVNLKPALDEMVRRAKQVPGGACGNWGACGAGISTGMFVSIVTKSSPLATKAWSLSNLMTSKSLEKISMHGGPRCCKRDSYIAVLTAVDFVAEHLGVHMTKPQSVVCSRSAMNNQCRGAACPFNVPVFKIEL